MAERHQSADPALSDILAFVESGPLLRPSAPIAGDGMHIVYDFDEARDCAYRRYLTDADDALNWTDLREREAGQIDGGTEVEALWETFVAAIPPRVPEPYADVVDDIVADLFHAASSRAAFGEGDRLFDRMWSAYRQGGWPCGWEGAYPDGRLIVYQPPL